MNNSKIISIIPSFSKTSLPIVAPIIAASVLLTGCHTINYKEAAYSALRHNDCQRNQLEVFCTRSYQREYYEYERTRNELLQENKKTTGTDSWRMSKNDSIVL